jgi:aryl-alcohol dehydrogenase-like predicted oxidoreductase
VPSRSSRGCRPATSARGPRSAAVSARWVISPSTTARSRGQNGATASSKADSHAVLNRAYDVGIHFVDTANMYGSERGDGLSERIIGGWFDTTGRRDRIVLATKVYAPMTDWPNDGGLSARHIVAARDASLRRLRTNWIDIYQMHHVQRDTPWEEIWPAMETLVSQGKIVTSPAGTWPAPRPPPTGATFSDWSANSASTTC